MDVERLLHSARVRSETRPGDVTAEADELRARKALCEQNIAMRRKERERLAEVHARADTADRDRIKRIEREQDWLRQTRKDHGR